MENNRGRNQGSNNKGKCNSTAKQHNKCAKYRTITLSLIIRTLFPSYCPPFLYATNFLMNVYLFYASFFFVR